MSNRSLRTPLSVLLTALVLSTLSFAVTSDRIAGAINSSNGVALQRSLHPQAQSKFDQGPVEPSFTLGYMTLMTQPSPAQQKALTKLLAEQQDRKSRNYHKWLTPAQYADQFGLSQHDMDRITSWLKSQGFVIKSIGGGRNSVVFAGTAAQVQSAFKAEIHRYNLNGEEHFANSTPLTIPAELSGIVNGITGVHNFLSHPASVGGFPSGPRTRAEYYDANFIFPNFLSPADIAVMYDINGLYNATPAVDGTGQTLAIVGRTDIFLADINDFRTGFGLPPITASNCTLNSIQIITACNDPLLAYVVIPGQTDPGVPDSVLQGDIVEADLDVEWSGAVASGAQIIYINAPQSDVFDSLSYAINPPTGTPLPAPVISMSFGLCEFNAGSIETELQQAATEGITVVNSSGDSGAAACDNVPNNASQPFNPAIGGQGVNYPASSTWVIAVGGNAISLANDTTNASQYWTTPNPNAANGLSIKSYIPEVPWNDNESLAQYCATPGANQNLCNPQFTAPAVGTPITSAQTAQEDFWISAGGGGASNCFFGTGNVCTGGIAQPSWQTGLTVANAPAGVRWVPDVSFLASPNFAGYVFCTPQNPDASTPTYTSTCSPGGANGIFAAVDNFGSFVGGTSASAPLFAGILALMNQSLAAQGLGDIHQTLYTLAATSPTAFNPVTIGDNKVFCQPGTPGGGQPATVVCPSTGPNTGIIGFNASDADATTGYNLVTGLGSVNASHLAAAWSALRATGPTVTVTPSLSSIFQTQSVTLTATISPIPTQSFLGNVTFTSGSTVLGTAAVQNVSGQGQAQLATTQLPVGSPDTITATFNGNSALGTSSGNTSVTVTQAFSLNLTNPIQPTSYTTTPGAPPTQATVNLVFGSGFTGTVSFSCPSPGSEITCTAPTQTNASSCPAPCTVSFAVQTTAPTTGALRRPFDRGSRTFYAALLPGLLGIMFTFGARKRSFTRQSRRGIQLLGLILVLGVSTMWMSSCGGSKNSSTSNPGTPAGTYVINVSATSTGLTSATAQFQLVVQ